MKPCKSVLETSEEELFIKSRQISRQNHIYQGLMLKLDRSSTSAVFVENYEIRISRSDFTHIHVYLYRISFLTTLDIYEDYFKGRHKMMQEDATWCKVIIHSNCDQRQFALIHLSLEEAAALYAVRFCDQGASWSSSCGWIE